MMKQVLRQAVAPYGGRLEQSGDGSALVVIEADHLVATDHAALAARCALAIRELASGRPLAIAMGRSEATGALPGADMIDRASRLLSHAGTPPGDLPPIALDELSAGLIDTRFDVIERQAQLVLCGERAPVQGQRTLRGRPTSCVGRDWELGALTAIFDDCADEPCARAVMAIGPAGIGKSRLGAELVRRIRERHPDVAIWVGRGDSLRAGSTLDLLAQALRGALGIHEGEPLAARHDKIRARVAEHVPPGDRRSRIAGGGAPDGSAGGAGVLPRGIDQRRVAEFLGELVGAPFAADGEAGAALAAARQDAQLMSEQMRQAWLDFLHTETCAHPVLLLLDDLHWGDFGTVRFVDAALRDRGKQPWMVLALARPEVFEAFPKLWAQRHNVQEIRLKALGRKASERLIRQVLGDSVGSDTVEHLAKVADGNAFYLEELIRTAAGGKDAALPETVLAMVETRLARLPAEARRVLRAASVFGEVFWEGGVSALLGAAMSTSSVAEWLTRLIEHEVLALRPDSRFPGERELAFRHVLLRECTYATLTGDDRRFGHRRAGEWIEQRGEGNPMVLAGHFERGGDGTRAARHYMRAAQQAIHVLDPEATLARTGLGLACVPPPELRIALLGLRCEASCSLALVAATMPDAEALMQSAPRGSLPWVQAMLAYSQGTLLAGRIGDLLAAIGLLQEVEPAPEAVGRWALALVVSTNLLDVLGRVREGTALEQHCAAIVHATADREPIARFWWCTAIGLRASYAHDDPWTGLCHSEAIRAIFDRIGGEQLFLNMELFRGLNLWYLGAFEPAVRALEGIVAGDGTLGVVSSLRRLGLSWVYADRGALDQARALATQLSDYGRAHGNRLEEGRGRWVLAEVLRRMGDLAAADREAQVALDMAVPLEQPGVLATLSAIRLAQGRSSDALAAAQDALARGTAMGGCGLFRGALMRLTHAEALHATGARAAARSAVAQARAYLLAVADKIADPSYRTSFLDQVPENARTLALASAWLGGSDAGGEVDRR
jgi:tetratricopeptide (TPR) repeat protein